MSGRKAHEELSRKSPAQPHDANSFFPCANVKIKSWNKLICETAGVGKNILCRLILEETRIYFWGGQFEYFPTGFFKR